FQGPGGGASCSRKVFADACVGKECGGLGCGACDDRTSVCNQYTSQCVSFCDGAGLCNNRYCSTAELCGGEAITNANGYAQTCPDRPTATAWGEQCVDATGDVSNCGGCGNQCAQGARCNGGSCVCPNDKATICDGRCVDLATDADHCGACGAACS